ncbi:unnamed protein product [Dovyalis caffra]|uniref:Uncharacterized protein n=1 Tax=Dovyalis caffra TaxID=77055 RepID=A0AAV1R8Y3_9ROSI|nr:unnamed protein product [Dovyalis caffra]
MAEPFVVCTDFQAWCKHVAIQAQGLMENIAVREEGRDKEVSRETTREKEIEGIDKEGNREMTRKGKGGKKHGRGKLKNQTINFGAITNPNCSIGEEGSDEEGSKEMTRESDLEGIDDGRSREMIRRGKMGIDVEVESQKIKQIILEPPPIPTAPPTLVLSEAREDGRDEEGSREMSMDPTTTHNHEPSNPPLPTIAHRDSNHDIFLQRQPPQPSVTH